MACHRIQVHNDNSSPLQGLRSTQVIPCGTNGILPGAKGSQGHDAAGAVKWSVGGKSAHTCRTGVTADRLPTF